jgi:hypothetical protein
MGTALIKFVPQEIMNIAITVNFTGTPDAEDILAANQIVFSENKDRAALNPPGTPLPLSTAAELKASYISLLQAEIIRRHVTNILNAKSNDAVAQHFTPAQVEQIRINLITQLNAGASVASVIAKTV